MHPDIPPMPYEDVKDFVMPLNFDRQYRTRVSEVIDAPEFYQEMDVIPGAVEAMNLLAEHFNVFICTSPLVTNLNCTTDKMRWIANNLGHNWLKRTIVSYDKTVIDGVALIDDKPKVKGAHTPTWTHIHFRYPYNQHIANDFEVVGWSEASCKRIIEAFA